MANLKIVKITMVVEERKLGGANQPDVLVSRWQFDTGSGSHSLKTAFDEAAEKQNEAVTRLLAEVATPAPRLLDAEGKVGTA